MKEDDFTNGMVTAETLCQFTSLTDQRHRQMAQAGCFPPPKQGYYQLEPTIQGLLKYYRERNDKTKKSISDERFKKLRAERKMAELQLEKLTDKVLDADEVKSEWLNIILIARQKFLGLENKISTRLAFNDEQRVGLRKEIEETLTELGKPMLYDRSKK
jgi:hypothetical protein